MDAHSANQSNQDEAGGLAAVNRARLQPHSDLTFATFDKLKVEAADVRQSLFTGSLIRDSSWMSVIFSRSDIDGARIEKSSFKSCEFANCDLRSSFFVATTFVSCNFNDAFIHDCTFEKCIFITCSFEGSSFTSCNLAESRLEQCLLSRSTFLHNRFVLCSIAEMSLGDCTFLYSSMTGSAFVDVTMNADSIGAILGLTTEQIGHLSLMFLGKIESSPDTSRIVPLLLEEYSRRKWHLHCLVLRLNCQLAAPLVAIRSYLDLVRRRYSLLGFAKGDELDFFGSILKELSTQNRLPLLVLTEVVQWCVDLQEHFTALSHGSEDRAIATLSSTARLLYYELIDRLDACVLPLEGDDLQHAIRLSVTFDQKPGILVHDLLASLQDAAELPTHHPPRFLGDRSGSYTEIVATTVFSVVALQVFLFLVNGCVIQLTELKHRLKVFAGKQSAGSYSKIALHPTQKASPLLLSLLSGLTQHAKGLGWLSNPDLSGYDSANIKTGELSSEGTRR